MIDRRLEFFAVYDHPSDYPNAVVVRRWVYDGERTVPDAEPLAVELSIEDARQAIRRVSPTMFNLGRELLDDPAIAEVWF